MSWALELGTTAMRVHDARIVERLSQPYEVEIDVVDEAAELDPDAAMGADVVLRWDRESSARALHGVVLDLSLESAQTETPLWRLRVGPVFRLASLVVRSRFFQGMSVPDIVAAVLGELFAARRRKLDTSRLSGVHAPRDYCVQYRESDQAFVERILAQEGIGYAFEHEGDRETMVLFDDPTFFAATVVEGAEEAGPLAYRATAADLADAEGITAFASLRSFTRGTEIRRGWDWASTPPAGWQDTARGDDATELERGFASDLFEEVRAVERSDATFVRETETRARRGLQHARFGSRCARARANAIRLAPGRTFELHGHPDVSLDRRWLVTEIRHEGGSPRADGLGATHANYASSLSCIPVETPWQPTPLRRPRIDSVQLGTVIGPQGDEIHTDRHGRVRVRMHWHDALAEPECWLRVATSWAGTGFGAQFVPRIGMEVIVAFVDGNPDLPMVVGCVPNGTNVVPFALPEEAARTGWRTATTPGGDGHNELSFADGKGQEQIRLHAQRDLDEVVRANHSLTVGGSQTETIGRDRTVTVSGHDSATAKSDHARLVVGSEHVGVGGSVFVDVMGGPHRGKVGEMGLPPEVGMFVNVHGKYVLKVDQVIELQCGDNSITLSPTGITVKSNMAVNLVCGQSMVSLSPGTLVTMAPMMAMQTKGSAIGLTPDSVAVTAKKSIELRHDDSKTLVRGSGVEVVTQGSVYLSGNDATLESETETRILGASTRLADGAAGVIEIIGGVIKLNCSESE